MNLDKDLIYDIKLSVYKYKNEVKELKYYIDCSNTEISNLDASIHDSAEKMLMVSVKASASMIKKEIYEEVLYDLRWVDEMLRDDDGEMGNE